MTSCSFSALAIGLGHLYLDESIVATGDAVETLAVASALKFDSLIAGCCNVMINNLATDTVCVYLEAATRVSTKSERKTLTNVVRLLDQRLLESTKQSTLVTIELTISRRKKPPCMKSTLFS